MIPTSNHNPSAWYISSQQLYIFWFLHQTTTGSYINRNNASCISFDSYIKPQLGWAFAKAKESCISFDSYIKPQLYRALRNPPSVVYLLIPTSNHNCPLRGSIHCQLYIFWFLHQTTTASVITSFSVELYIFWFLHQTTTSRASIVESDLLYIFWFLHQTTTHLCSCYTTPRCISFDSYIKPQLLFLLLRLRFVVYLLIPTSNHNYIKMKTVKHKLYIFWFLHQTTTPAPLWWSCGLLYIFWFLHQTTTLWQRPLYLGSCISFDSYIKPQHSNDDNLYVGVVYLLIPTSNHNPLAAAACLKRVVYLLIPTSNHNEVSNLIVGSEVVYLLIPTSNHNWRQVHHFLHELYIFWFLHQTTTSISSAASQICCISFDSYIKPQLDSYVLSKHPVVYLLIPTSNHNHAMLSTRLLTLYIFWFLHQTTTALSAYLEH